MNLPRANLILGILVAILAIPVAWSASNDSTEFVNADDRELLFDGFTPEQVARVRIEQPAVLTGLAPTGPEATTAERAVLTLEQFRAGEWQVAVGQYATLPVRAELMQQRLFRHLPEIGDGPDSVLERDADDERLEEFRLTDELGTRVQCFDAAGTPLVDLLIGKRTTIQSTDGQSVVGYFVREHDARDVILYEEKAFGLRAVPADWLDPRIFPSDPEEVGRLRLQGPDATVEMQRPADRPSDWVATEGGEQRGPIRPGEVTGLLRRISATQISDLAGEPLPEGERRTKALSDVGLLPPRGRVELETFGGRTFGIDLGLSVPGGTTVFARIDGLPFLIQVDPVLPTIVTKDIDGLFSPKR